MSSRKLVTLITVMFVLVVAAPGVAGAQATIGEIDVGVIAAIISIPQPDYDENGLVDTVDLQCFVDTFLGDAGMEAAYAINYAQATVDSGPLASSLKVDVIVAMFACVDGAGITDEFLDGMMDFGALGACTAGAPRSRKASSASCVKRPANTPGTRTTGSWVR